MGIAGGIRRRNVLYRRRVGVVGAYATERMTMLKTSLVMALLIATTSTSVLAQGRGRQASDDEQKACSRDVSRLCRKVMNDGDMVVLNCLRENRAKLGRACKKVLEENGQ